MDAVDLNFTYSIVGPPQSVVLGSRMAPRDYSSNGVDIDMRQARHKLREAWLEWWFLRSGDDWIGRARSRPRRIRLWLESHGLLLAGIGLALLLAELAAAGIWLLLQVH
ncbi:hypothetical protein [Caenimonas koreensis]|uniref:Uncharacterized protein n=1 Tax=Caenimonas koreensis DSM 17982 TaxID=1121255 RepID=A0A844ARZ9_9BURK|nr:hypothetical protein [Caenimonas koreensis]MRD47190.1 hypothetical protein [Caenimonas koreensis DSM 17982]